MERFGDPEEVLRRIREHRIGIAASRERDEAVDERIEVFAAKVRNVSDPAERRRLEDEVERMRMQGVQSEMYRQLSERMSYVEEAVLYVADELGKIKRQLGEP